jgi:hypothetical protein
MESPPLSLHIELTCSTTGRWLDRLLWARPKTLLPLGFALDFRTRVLGVPMAWHAQTRARSRTDVTRRGDVFSAGGDG